MDDWDSFAKWLGAAETTLVDAETQAMAAPLDIDRLAVQHVRLTRLVDAASSALEQIERLIEHAHGQLPTDEPHVFNTPDGTHEITMVWPQRRKWDHDMLASLVSPDPNDDPPFVERKITIKRAAFDKATTEERAEFEKALSVHLSSAKITVKRIA